MKSCQDNEPATTEDQNKSPVIPAEPASSETKELVKNGFRKLFDGKSNAGAASHGFLAGTTDKSLSLAVATLNQNPLPSDSKNYDSPCVSESSMSLEGIIPKNINYRGGRPIYRRHSEGNIDCTRGGSSRLGPTSSPISLISHPSYPKINSRLAYPNPAPHFTPKKRTRWRKIKAWAAEKLNNFVKKPIPSHFGLTFFRWWHSLYGDVSSLVFKFAELTASAAMMTAGVIIGIAGNAARVLDTWFSLIRLKKGNESNVAYKAKQRAARVDLLLCACILGAAFIPGLGSLIISLLFLCRSGIGSLLDMRSDKQAKLINGLWFSVSGLSIVGIFFPPILIVPTILSIALTMQAVVTHLKAKDYSAKTYLIAGLFFPPLWVAGLFVGLIKLIEGPQQQASHSNPPLRCASQSSIDEKEEESTSLIAEQQYENSPAQMRTNSSATNSSATNSSAMILVNLTLPPGSLDTNTNSPDDNKAAMHTSDHDPRVKKNTWSNAVKNLLLCNPTRDDTEGFNAGANTAAAMGPDV